jgi:hypothetical protein
MPIAQSLSWATLQHQKTVMEIIHQLFLRVIEKKGIAKFASRNLTIAGERYQGFTRGKTMNCRDEPTSSPSG